MGMQEVLQSLAERLHYSANVRTVFGDPLEAQGRTIIPVARVAYGLGGGAGRKKENEARQTAGDTPQQTRGPQTGGGGIAVVPVGVLEVLPGETRFIPFGGKSKKLAGAFLAGVAVGLLFRREKKAGPSEDGPGGRRRRQA